MLSVGDQLFGKDDISLDEAYWYGLLVGDGGLTLKGVTTLTNMDQHILDFCYKYLNNKKIKYHLYNTRGKAKNITIFNVKYRNELKNLGFDFCKSINKVIPAKIRMLSKKPLSMFLRGIYETDGWIEHEDGKPCICLGLSNKKLIDQIHLILLNFGIIAGRRIKKTYREDSHILTIYREFVPIFMNEIGLDSNGHKYKTITTALLQSENRNQKYTKIYFR